jgi:hypothetical protein
LDPVVKVSLAISDEYTTGILNGNLQLYYQRLKQLISQVPYKNLEDTRFYGSLSVFKRLYDNQVFGWPPTVDKGVLRLITHQNSLRQTFMEGW